MKNKLEIPRLTNQEKLSPEERLHIMRHSASHVLAMAVLRLFPNAQLGTGPAIDNGFYYDFKFSRSIDISDLKKIEAEMKKIRSEALPFEKIEVSLADAASLMNVLKQTYKSELVQIISQKGSTDVIDNAEAVLTSSSKIPTTVTLYQTGEEFVDLCRGPHVDNTSQIGSFQLTNIAAAHWRKTDGKPMLTRIYGLGFPDDQELSEYLEKRKLAEERDHRKLGRELNLFTFSEEVGPGLVLWLPNGATIRREMENFIVKEQIKRGYQHVYSPHIGQKGLWEKSGHWDLYREKMYDPMTIEDKEYLVKPMTCPIHCMMYADKPRSYRELPIRLAEVASVYRYEQSGELHGLLRVRAFTQDDAHIFARPDQVVDEFLGVFDFTQFLLKKFGFKDYKIRIGTRAKTEKYLGNDLIWQEAEAKLMEAVNKVDVPYVVKEGEAAFYGPKADFLLTDALGRQWQCGTVQIDFMLPERFGLTYTDKDGQQRRPVMIHRAPLGSMERFMAVLLENNGGSFPTWLSPIQVAVAPISEKHLAQAEAIAAELFSEQIRVTMVTDDTLNKRIRTIEGQKVPYMIIIGDKEVAENTISIRPRGGKNQSKSTLDEFKKAILKEIENKS